MLSDFFCGSVGVEAHICGRMWIFWLDIAQCYVCRFFILGYFCGQSLRQTRLIGQGQNRCLASFNIGDIFCYFTIVCAENLYTNRLIWFCLSIWNFFEYTKKVKQWTSGLGVSEQNSSRMFYTLPYVTRWQLTREVIKFFSHTFYLYLLWIWFYLSDIGYKTNQARRRQFI